MGKEGILIGCDRNQEWLLPWWWDHYSAHNAYPVAFADFGMSKKALAWCREKGKMLKPPGSSDVVPNKKSLQKKRSGGKAVMEQESGFAALPGLKSLWPFYTLPSN